ncbi:MAG: nucleoside phosphorylase [Bacteroidia bacterium]|nr:nucleoside phosphorylase [Bacteroidia bacterium]
MIPPSELILTTHGRIYHLGMHPQELADKVILVGDPGRVEMVAAHFSKRECEIRNREFHCVTGAYDSKRITVLSTGIGTDNIDIVINELDALANIDFASRTVKKELRSLEIVRIGTCGALQEDIPVDSFVVSSFGMGLDVLMNYYRGAQNHHDLSLQEQFLLQMKDWPLHLHKPLFFEGDSILCSRIGEGMVSGITATAPGFYGPQGRQLRLQAFLENMEERLGKLAFYHIAHDSLRICNFEMETSALYGLSLLSGHKAATVCAVVANRLRREFSTAHTEIMQNLIRTVLQRI